MSFKVEPINPNSQSAQTGPRKSDAQKAMELFQKLGSSGNPPPPDSAIPNTPKHQESQGIPESSGHPANIEASLEGISTPEASSLESAVAEVTQQSESTPEKPSAVKESPLSSQFAQLAKRERAMRQMQQELKAQKLAMEQKMSELESKFSNSRQSDPRSSQSQGDYISKEDLLKNPWQILNKHGLTYNDLTEKALESKTPEQVEFERITSELKSELQALKEEQSNAKKSAEEQQKKAYDDAISQIDAQVKHLVKTDPNYESIKFTGNADQVTQLIIKTYEKERRVMSVEEAAQEVEDYLAEQLAEAQKLSKIQKLMQARQQSNQTKSPTPPSSQAAPAQVKTLTNSVPSSRRMSDRDRAIAAFASKTNK